MLLIFSKPNCAGCSKLKAYLGDNINQPKIKEMNIMENKDLINKYELKGAPTTIVFDDKFQEVDRLVGFNGNQSDKDFIDEALKDI